MVGSGPDLERFIDLLEAHPIWGFQLSGVISDDPEITTGSEVRSHPVLGQMDETIDIIRAQEHLDAVIFVPTRVPLTALRPLLDQVELMGVPAHLSLNFFTGTIYRPVLESFETVPVVTYSPVGEAGLSLFVKEVFDRLAAAVALLLLSPLYLALAIAIKVTSERGAPIFYGQIRSGQHGRPFRLWKFRTMVPNADKLRADLEAMNEMDGPVFKIKKDPRITAVGAFLRKTSLDELPQLWNILVGHMSFVGPRPPIPSEVEQYVDWQRRRLSMKPGLTCLWQVSGRNLLDFETWMKLDLEYIDNWSLWLDVKILCRTFVVVVTGHGSS